MDWLTKARQAADLFKAARSAASGILDAVKDGKEGIDAKTAEEINALFEQERVENRATFESINSAVARYRERHGG